QISAEFPSSRRFAMMTLAASIGWYGSQNTYLLLSSHILDEGPHGIIPPNLPPPEQQAVFVLEEEEFKYYEDCLGCKVEQLKLS
ncbi:hypothetical protein HAX54_042281, partial [Datura stramonium]|nr:hypothetical protein [Datura stramonium]